MALIVPGSRCVICEQPLDRPYTATSGVVFPSTHHLYRYCDAPLHFDCLESWPHRREFSTGYMESTRAHFRHLKTLLIDSDEWIMGTGPFKPEHFVMAGLRPPAHSSQVPNYIEINMCDWPVRLKSTWEEWPVFLREGYRNGLAGTVITDADAVMQFVRQQFPDHGSIRNALARAG